MSARKSGPIDYNVLPEILRPLAERSEIRRFRKGSLVLDEGDRGDALLIILAGELRAFTGSDTGRHVTYGLFGPGDYLGEMGLDGGARMASVEALCDTTCAYVERATLTQYISERPQFAFERSFRTPRGRPVARPFVGAGAGLSCPRCSPSQRAGGCRGR